MFENNMLMHAHNHSNERPTPWLKVMLKEFKVSADQISLCTSINDARISDSFKQIVKKF